MRRESERVDVNWSTGIVAYIDDAHKNSTPIAYRVHHTRWKSPLSPCSPRGGKQSISPRQRKVPQIMKTFAKEMLAVEKETAEAEVELERARRMSQTIYRRSSISKPSLTLGHIDSMKREVILSIKTSSGRHILSSS